MIKHRDRQRRGFTLIEMMMALVIMSIILLGAFSVVLLAGKAIPDRTTGPAANLAAAKAVDQLTADLSYATAMSIANGNDIEFLVQDRDGNGIPDKIRYTWSGTAGTPLYRYYAQGDPATGLYTYNPAVSLVDNVQGFSLTYDKRATSYAVSGGESAEMRLASYTAASNLSNGTISGTSYVGEYFVPNLPPGAVAWKVTRVKFKARADGFPNGQLTVQMRTAVNGLPSLVALDSTTIPVTRFNSDYSWQQANFSAVTGLTPGTGLCMLLMLNSGALAGDVQYQNTASPTLSSNLLTSAGSSATWSAGIAQNLCYAVYGTVTSVSSTVSQYNLTGVRVSLRSGPDTRNRVRTTVRVLNEPPITGP